MASETPFNIVTLFTAHFHERRGPEIPFALPAGAEASLSNLEWKALPSGSHAIEKGDTLLFLTPDEDEKRVVLAVFSNRKTAADEVETRGNRMVAVGAVLACSGPDPSSHFAATSPHIRSLISLANQLSLTPDDKAPLEAYFAAHQGVVAPAAAAISRRFSLSSDPLLSLPTISASLGPLLPTILKRIIRPSHRLLIFVPPGTPPSRATSIAYALAELAHVAEAKPRVRGLLALPDLATLATEQTEQGWIAVTSDALFLEKPQLFDALLDLRPLVGEGKEQTGGNVLPHLSATTKGAGRKLQLARVQWSAADFALWREIESAIEHSTATAKPSTSDATTQLSPPTASRRQAKDTSNALAVLALIRYCLSGWLWLPLPSSRQLANVKPALSSASKPGAISLPAAPESVTAPTPLSSAPTEEESVGSAGSALARATYTEWSTWLRMLRANLLLALASSKSGAEMSAAEVKALGLSARSSADAELIEQLAIQQGVSVRVAKTWAWQWWT